MALRKLVFKTEVVSLYHTPSYTCVWFILLTLTFIF
jgi:hypothetical protein